MCDEDGDGSRDTAGHGLLCLLGSGGCCVVGRIRRMLCSGQCQRVTSEGMSWRMSLGKRSRRGSKSRETCVRGMCQDGGGDGGGQSRQCRNQYHLLTEVSLWYRYGSPMHFLLEAVCFVVVVQGGYQIISPTVTARTTEQISVMIRARKDVRLSHSTPNCCRRRTGPRQQMAR